MGLLFNLVYKIYYSIDTSVTGLQGLAIGHDDVEDYTFDISGGRNALRLPDRPQRKVFKATLREPLDLSANNLPELTDQLS